MDTEWIYNGEGHDEEGSWTRPVGDSTISVTIYPDEIADFPPLVEALERAEQRVRHHDDACRDAVFLARTARQAHAGEPRVVAAARRVIDEFGSEADKQANR